MAEAIPKQIADALKATFVAIVADGGVTYWYKPDTVVVCALTDTLWSSAAKGKTVYVVDPSDGFLTERGQSAEMVLGRLTIRLVVAKDLELASMNPWDLAGARFDEESRLVRDATRAILVDVTLGGIAYNTLAETLTVDYGLKMPGSWCAAALEFEVEYSTPKATP
jgi:hypothetical protein